MRKSFSAALTVFNGDFIIISDNNQVEFSIGRKGQLFAGQILEFDQVARCGTNVNQTARLGLGQN